MIDIDKLDSNQLDILQEKDFTESEDEEPIDLLDINFEALVK